MLLYVYKVNKYSPNAERYSYVIQSNDRGWGFDLLPVGAFHNEPSNTYLIQIMQLCEKSVCVTEVM